jgi:NADH:ubiquinone oxidoreductase subunit
MLKFLTTVSSSASVRLFTLFSGKRVGTDAQGNIYYTGKARKGYKRERRWVIYNGVAEASRIPPEWHGWMHHQTDEMPQDNNPLRRNWQLPPQANQTGSAGAYVPPGHSLRGNHRDAATGDYQSWTPEN